VNLDTQFQIAERAYFIWKQKGCPDGKALDNWLQAEAELSTVKRPGRFGQDAPRATLEKQEAVRSRGSGRLAGINTWAGERYKAKNVFASCT
jgi:hypothetical protein